MARSRHLQGPYELHPDQTILSSRHRPDLALQRAGHADLVDTADGQTYMVYLCGRPLRNRGTCTLEAGADAVHVAAFERQGVQVLRARAR